MKNLIAVLLAAAVLSAALAGCGSKKTIEPQSLVDELLKEAGFTDSLDRVDGAVIPILYGVEEDDYTSALVYCGTAATAEEIAVFEAVDDAAAERLLAAAGERVDHQIEIYKAYGPAQAMTLENSIVERSGNYVIVVVCSNGEGAKAVVDQYI